MTHPNDELKACRGAFDVFHATKVDGTASEILWEFWQAACAWQTCNWNTRAKEEASQWRQAIQEHAMATECISWDRKKPWDVINEIIMYHVNLAKDDPKGSEAVAWQYRNITDEGPSPCWHHISQEQFEFLKGDKYAEVRELYTSPNPTADEARDANRLNYVAQQCYSMRKRVDGRNNAFVWTEDFPIHSAGVEANMRASIDEAMAERGEVSNG